MEEKRSSLKMARVYLGIILIAIVTAYSPFNSSVSAEVQQEGTSSTQTGPAQEHADSLIFKGCSIIRRAFMTEASSAYEKATGRKIDVMGGRCYTRHQGDSSRDLSDRRFMQTSAA